MTTPASRITSRPAATRRGSATRRALLTGGHGGRIDTLICGVDGMVIVYDPRVVQDIERRHRVAEGSFDRLLHLRSASIAAAGLISHPQWLRYVHDTIPSQAAVQEWFAYHGELNQPLADLLAHAKQAGVRVLLLANATYTLWDDLAHHGIGHLAERVFCSAEVGYLKPDPRAYQYVLDNAGANPAYTLYVDAQPSWIRDSRQLGMRGHRYTSVEQLRGSLARAGVAL